MSHFQDEGLSIGIYTSVNAVVNPIVPLDTYADQVASYEHTLSAYGGYMSATIKLNGNLNFCEDWYAEGLGRHVVVRDEAQKVVFEGFVNAVKVTLGALTATRGPLMQIANRVQVIYSGMETSVAPPIIGNRRRLGVSNDTNSQAKYGIIQRIISAGSLSITDAAALQATYLAENKDPVSNETLSFGSTATQPQVELEVLGYINWLDLYVYNNLNSSTVTASAKVQAILVAAWNGNLFSPDYNLISTNSLAVPRYDNDDRTALAALKAVVALGDAAGTRYVYGFQEGRRLMYAPVATTLFDYRHRLADNSQRLEDAGGNTVKPWAVLPAKWILIADFLTGETIPANVAEDPRALFAETVSYTFPYSLTITGGQVNTVSQKLARLGLSGLG